MTGAWNYCCTCVQEQYEQTTAFNLVGLLARVLIFKWCHSKALFKIHVYGWGWGTLISRIVILGQMKDPVGDSLE